MKVAFENWIVKFERSAPTYIENLCFMLSEHNQRIFELRDVLVFPGLVNAHDHLDFDLFPFLGKRIYTDYKEWSAEIHLQNKLEIESATQIPTSQRIRWGVLKNLVAGVTHIVHHGNYHDKIPSFGYPIYLNYQYLHALDTEPFWKIKLLKPSRKDIMIHIGEGLTDEFHKEIDKLLQWNWMNRTLIGIHAIGMNECQSKKFKAIVWCPDSNLRLYGKTAKIDLLKKHTKILFGTDSSLTASSNIWEHLRIARKLNLLSDQEIFESLTSVPENVLSNFTNSGVVVARKNSQQVYDSFFSLRPEDLLLVSVNNKVTLIDRTVLQDTPEGYTLVSFGHSYKWIPTSFASIISELLNLRVKLPMEINLA